MAQPLSLRMVLPKVTNVFVHVISWLLFFSLIISFDSLSSGSQNTLSELFTVNYLIFYLLYLFIFYCNLYVLVPVLYLKKHYVAYVLVIGLLLTAVYLIQPFDKIFNHQQPSFNQGPGPEPFDPIDHHQPPPPHNNPQHIDIVSIILFFMIWSVSTAILIIRKWRFTEKRAVLAEADKAYAELSFLKAQINPHFLFNTLNNIYSLAVTKSDQTAAAVLKLSNIMRYMTDEVSQDYVSLENEIECIRDYIDLQRIRFNNHACINFSVTGNATGKQIAPLVIMTFIENVFKYGISSHEPSEIIIKIFIDRESVDFFCQNKVFPGKQNKDRTGIGISNTKQRLEHLYPSQHLLNIISTDDLYTVHLSLKT